MCYGKCDTCGHVESLLLLPSQRLCFCGRAHKLEHLPSDQGLEPIHAGPTLYGKCVVVEEFMKLEESLKRQNDDLKCTDADLFTCVFFTTVTFVFCFLIFTNL